MTKSISRSKDKRKVKPYTGRPELLRKGSAHKDRTKYTRKDKHGQRDT